MSLTKPKDILTNREAKQLDRKYRVTAAPRQRIYADRARVYLPHYLDRYKFAGKIESMMDFVDPNSLEVGKIYTLSKNTPLMSSFEPISSSVEGVIAQIQDSLEIQKGGKILIRERKRGGIPNLVQRPSG